MELLLGLDIGTSGVKGLLIDTKGNTVASHTEEYDLHQPEPGWAEQDPADWWAASKKVIRLLLKMADVKGEAVKGIGLSGQMHGSVFLDADNNVIRECLLWCDQRTAAESEDMVQQIGRSKLRKSMCNTVLPGFTIPKILWLRNNEPQNFEKVKTVLLPKDYIRFLLTGEKATEVSDASGTLVFDVKNREWADDIIKELDLDPGLFPERVYESIDVIGNVTEAVAKETGLAAGTHVVGGGADNSCAATGTGVVSPGQAMACLGTSGVVFVPTAAAESDKDLRIHSFCHSVPNVWYLMGCMLSAGGALQWYRNTLGGEETALARLDGGDAYDYLMAAAGKAPVGSEGLIFLPYLMGERCPHGDPSARGVFFGLSSRHSKGHLTRAVVEGVTYGMRDMLDVIRESGAKFESIRATGGGARSPLWRQVMADVFNVPVETINAEEGPAFGAALMAGVGAGIYDDLAETATELVEVTGITEPIKENTARYNEYFKFYQGLYKRLKHDFPKLQKLVQE